MIRFDKKRFREKSHNVTGNTYPCMYVHILDIKLGTIAKNNLNF